MAHFQQSQAHTDENTISNGSAIPRPSASTPKPSSQGFFSFLQLPPEIRNMIYKLVLTSLCGTTHWKWLSEPTIYPLPARPLIDRAWGLPDEGESTGQPARFPTVAILRTCRQIHSEALPFLYQNRLAIHIDGWYYNLPRPRLFCFETEPGLSLFTNLRFEFEYFRSPNRGNPVDERLPPLS
jgi:hypothetical protein